MNIDGYANCAHPAKRRRRVYLDDDRTPNTNASCGPSTASQEIPHPHLKTSDESLVEVDAVGDINGKPANGTLRLARNVTSPSPSPSPSGECCYGMLCDIPAILRSGVNARLKTILVDFHRPNHLSTKHDGLPIDFEITCAASARIVAELKDTAEIKTQLNCHSKLVYASDGHNAPNRRRRGKQKISWSLNIIIFGKESLAEKVGEYLSKRKMYLQDPLGCDRRVFYRNPHILPPESGEIVMADSFDLVPGNVEIERLEEGPDLLAQLMEDDIALPETEAPDSVKTDLFGHQKQALTFMVQREDGWALDSPSDIWNRQRDSSGRLSYKNNVSGYCNYEAPPIFRGGLLADDMGLGKTLSMICLIAANQARHTHPSRRSKSRDLGAVEACSIKTTLLIVPPALIQTWEKQLYLHLKSGELRSYVYHGQNRERAELLEQYDVVITTYHTVAAIWRQHNTQSNSERDIFSMTWHRVVLDEAHIIQNPQSQLAQACCALRASRRWAITGTPIQNKLADFASIVRFLRVYPYSDQKTFEEEIIKPWQNRRTTDARGFLRLKTLVRAITIRRTKAVIKLPPRIDEIHHLEFTAVEREKYETAKSQSKAMFEDAISSGTQNFKAFNALCLLNQLRLICNHGLLAQSITAMTKTQPSEASFSGWSPSEASGSFPGALLLDGSSCSNCDASILDDLLEGPATPTPVIELEAIPSNQMLCEKCRSQAPRDSSGDLPWGRQDSMDSAEGTTTPGTLLFNGDMVFTIESMSTKIKGLIADLLKHNANEKSVVFSYWTNTLDLIQLMLNDNDIPYVRIDGKMSLPRRNESLYSFQYDDSVRVILVSITCGGAGLDLTAGSRVYLLEPHWNPMIEEQALCRVHRVGQKRNVTTIRYLMRDSFEEQIVEIQKRKKKLAQVTFSQGPLSQDGMSLGILQYLRSALE